MAARVLTVLERIAQAVSSKKELTYMQTLPQFEAMSPEEIKSATAHILAQQESNPANRVDRQFLTYVFEETGTENPWRASAEHDLVDTVLRRTDADIEKKGRVIARGARKQELVRQHFGFFNPETGSSFNAGITNAYKFRTTFGTPKQRTIIENMHKDPGRVRDQLDEATIAYLGDIQALVNQAKEDPEFLAKVRSTKTKGDIYALKEVEKMMHECAQIELEAKVESLSEAMARIGLQPRRFLVKRQSRSDFFDYWDEHVADSTELDQFAYGLLRSPDANYPEQIKQMAFGLLFGKYAQNKFVNADVVIGAEKDDMEYLRSLDDEDELVQAHGRPRVSGLDDILSRSEINLLEAGRILDADDFITRRRTAWQQYINEDYLSDLEKLPELFEKEFVDEDGNLKSLTIRKELSQDHDYSTVLTQPEWRAVLDWYVLTTLHDGVDRMVDRTAIRDVRQKADQVVAAVRKVRYLNNLLDDHEAADITKIPKPVLAQLAQMRKGTYIPIEKWDAKDAYRQHLFSQHDVETVEELPRSVQESLLRIEQTSADKTPRQYQWNGVDTIERLEAVHSQIDASSMWYSHGTRLIRLAENGLFDPRVNIGKFIPKLARFIDTENSEAAAKAKEVLDHPAVQYNSSYRDPAIPRFANARQWARMVEIGHTPVNVTTTSEDWKDYRATREETIIDGSLEGQLSLQRASSRIWDDALTRTSWGGIVFDGEAFQKIHSQYAPVTEEFLHQIKYLSLRSSSGMLEPFNLGVASTSTWSLAHREKLPENTLVRTDLITQVDEIYSQIQAMEPVRINFQFDGPDRKFNGYNRRQGQKFSFDPSSANWSIDVPKNQVDATIKEIYSHSSNQPELSIEEVEL